MRPPEDGQSQNQQSESEGEIDQAAAAHPLAHVSGFLLVGGEFIPSLGRERALLRCRGGGRGGVQRCGSELSIYRGELCLQECTLAAKVGESVRHTGGSEA